MIQARHLALKVLYKINEEGAFANIALDKALSDYSLPDSRDKGFVTELVYGITKFRGRLDYVLNLFAKPKTEKMSPWVRNILRLGLYQIMFLDKVPVSAAINEAVKLTKKYEHQGAVKFVNGVLRNIDRNKEKIKYPSLADNPVEHLQIVYSFPKWLVELFIEQLGVESALNICSFFNESAPLWLRTNTLKINRQDLIQAFVQMDLRVKESNKTPEGILLQDRIDIGKTEIFKDGLFTVQDESSMLVSHILSPKPGQTILDVCSGPGGKTSHLAQLMQNKGEIYAFDVHAHRLKLIEETCTRMGITNVKTYLHDARNISQKLNIKADAVLVDAPCSGLGVLGRRADARWQKSLEDIPKLQEIQKEILSEAAGMLKPGGTLVYSTCTITKEENIDVINDFLRKNDDFYLDNEINKYLPFELAEESKGWIQFLPYQHQTDGFFIARLVRKK